MWIFAIGIIYNLIECIDNNRLTSPTLLIPCNIDIPTNYTLAISNGCYEWISSNDAIAIISRNDCSSEITISAVTKICQRQVVSVTAKNINTENAFYCDIIIDNLNTIEINSVTTELMVEGVPSVFKVIGKNQNGDTFSSLCGIEFEWMLPMENNSKSTLQFLKYADSTYEYESSLYWEQQNSKGSSVLIQGIEIGIGKISVRPKNSVYTDIKTQEKEIVIKSNIKFKKEVLYLLLGSKYKLSAEIIKKGKSFDVTTLPDNYVMKVKNSSVVEVTNKFDLTAKHYGKSVVRFARKNIKESKRLHSSTSIYIVEPSYMTLNILPENNWALHETNLYIVIVKLFDIYHHQISLADNVFTYVQFPSKSFHVNYSSPNGTYHIVQATVAGSGIIKAHLVGVKNENGKKLKYHPEIRTSQQYIIYQSLQVYPPVLLLPWDSSVEMNHTVPFKVLGGSGFYKWSSSNSEIGTISYSSGEKSNIATVFIKKLGNINITVVDAQNEFLYNIAKISIQLIADLEIMPTILETQINNDVIVPVSLYGYEDDAKTKLKVFDECSKISLNIEVVDKARFTHIKDTEYMPIGRGCQSLQFTCKFPGHSRIFIKFGNNKKLTSTTIIGCSKPLKPIYPERVAVVALSSSIEVAFEGGPRLWPMYQKGYYDDLIAQKENFVNIHAIKDPYRYNKDLHVYQVMCKAIDQSKLELNVGNVPSATLTNPAKDQSFIQFICAIPNSVHLRIHKVFQKRPTSSSLALSMIDTEKDKQIEIDLWVKDEVGRKFSNISSLDIHWKLSDYTLAKLENHRDVINEINGANGYNRISRNYQILHLTGKEGALKITANINGYQIKTLNHIGIKEANFSPISESIELKLTSSKNLKANIQEGTCTKDSCPKL